MERQTALLLLLVGVAAFAIAENASASTYTGDAGTPAPGPFDWLAGLGNDVGGLNSNPGGYQGASATDVSPAGIDALRAREAFSPVSYPDPPGSGKRSIGYGHQILPGEGFAEPISEAEGAFVFANDVAGAAAVVRDAVTVPLSQNMFDALTSLVFNIGRGAFATSTLLRLLNAGDYSSAANQFPVWRMAGGRVSATLEARRAQEQQTFLA